MENNRFSEIEKEVNALLPYQNEGGIMLNDSIITDADVE